MLGINHAAIGDVCTRRYAHPSICRMLAENESDSSSAAYTLNVEWTEIALEVKSEYYSDDEEVSWQLSSEPFNEDIQNAGGIIVGVSMMLEYPNEDESPNPGLCTGLEDNVEDIIYGTASKNEWTLTQNDVNPGAHAVNLTWHNQSLLEMENISGLSEDEIMDQIDFGEMHMAPTTSASWSMLMPSMATSALTQTTVSRLQVQSVCLFSM